VAFPAEYKKRFSKGRDPRRLHFDIHIKGDNQNYETNASCVCQVPREVLLEIKPDFSYDIGEPSKYDLKNWLAERYRQSTWPDAFNNALRPAEKRLKRFWGRYRDYISGMYIQLNSYEEIGTDR